jgi:hypothetical protein
MQTQRRHISNYEAYMQQVRAFITVMEEGYDFKEIDFDQYRAFIGEHSCFVSFWPTDKDICTLSVIRGGKDETLHFEDPCLLAEKLSQLKQPVHAIA